MKTIEEEIRIFHSNNPADLGCEYSIGVHAGYEKGFKSGVEFAQQWYSVEDELPCSPYLGKDKLGKIELFNINEKSFIKEVGITHWRPIEYK